MQPIASTVQGTVWLFLTRCGILSDIMTKMKIIFSTVLGTALFFSVASGQHATPKNSGPEYTSDGQLKFPENYRNWIYLTTGFDMSYNPAMDMGHHMFDNVFVNPEAYGAFVDTGTWPDKTMLLIEARGAQSKGSINQVGNFQSGDVMAVEVHVKDDARFPGKWAFFGFDGDQAGTQSKSKAESKTEKMIPTTASCYTCHSQHAAVDTTFVQFYPTLLPIAKSKGTLSSSYVKEAAEKETVQKDAAPPYQK